MDQAQRALVFRLFNEIGIISQLGRAMMDARLPGGLSTTHFSVVNHLSTRPQGQTPLALANAFQVPKNTMTHTLSGLEREALIALHKNPQDGRSKLVRITEKGFAFREAAIQALDPDLMAFAETFDIETITNLVSQLAEMRVFLDAARD